MPGKPLRIAWLGPTPGGSAGVRAVAAELLLGLSRRGHQIDCFFPAAEDQANVLIAGDEQIAFGEGNLAFGDDVALIWGTSRWQWNRWYSRNKVSAFLSGMLARAVASLRLRRAIARRHRQRPYDLVYQFSNIETPALPSRLARSVPLVIHPETHIAGELRWLWRERRIALRSQSALSVTIVAATMLLRAIVQRRSIRRASLVVCISSVFRDHLVRDYGFPVGRTAVVPNPQRGERFAELDPQPTSPPTVLVLGRISTRKGIEDVVAVARALAERGVEARVRVVGGPSLFSDYTPLLAELPAGHAEYAGHLASAGVPDELAHSAILLQASKYEPFGLTVAEALAAGVPVIATSEVGAIEGVDRRVVTEVAPGDVEAIVSGVVALLARLGDESEAREIRTLARAEASRLFDPDSVCERISAELEGLVAGRR
jgi:glycosyltransferase involved in cell wall biosynthesis